MMVRETEERDRNRSPAYCQRVTAETAAHFGDLPIANKYLGLLAQGKSELAFYRVGPLTTIAWQQLRAGDKAGANKTLDDALAAAAELPSIGRYSIDAAAWLTAALVSAGRKADRARWPLRTTFPRKGRQAASWRR